MSKYEILGFLALIMAGIRFFIPTHPLSPSGSYEAVAHLFVGGLIGAFLASKQKGYLAIAGLLSLVELVAFFTLK